MLWALILAFVIRSGWRWLGCGGDGELVVSVIGVVRTVVAAVVMTGVVVVNS